MRSAAAGRNSDVFDPSPLRLHQWASVGSARHPDARRSGSGESPPRGAHRRPAMASALHRHRGIGGRDPRHAPSSGRGLPPSRDHAARRRDRPGFRHPVPPSDRGPRGARRGRPPRAWRAPRSPRRGPDHQSLVDGPRGHLAHRHGLDHSVPVDARSWRAGHERRPPVRPRALEVLRYLSDLPILDPDGTGDQDVSVDRHDRGFCRCGDRDAAGARRSARDDLGEPLLLPVR